MERFLDVPLDPWPGDTVTTGGSAGISTWDFMRRPPKVKPFRRMRLSLAWSVALSPGYQPAQSGVTRESAFRTYLTETAPRLTALYGLAEGWVPLTWLVCGRPESQQGPLLIEDPAPHQIHLGDGPRPEDFLDHYTPPTGSVTGQTLNWVRDLPLEPECFLGPVLGFEPAPLTPMVNLLQLADAANVRVPVRRLVRARTTVAPGPRGPGLRRSSQP